LRWTPGRESVAYTSSEGENVKIMVHSLNEKEPPRSLAAFPVDSGGLIQAFAWLPEE
jgi:hypothetical protein